MTPIYSAQIYVGCIGVKDTFRSSNIEKSQKKKVLNLILDEQGLQILPGDHQHQRLACQPKSAKDWHPADIGVHVNIQRSTLDLQRSITVWHFNGML